MCGICGILSYANGHTPQPGRVEAMCAAMRYRGPDDIGYYRNSHIHMGHVRLSIIDVGGGHQPMANEDNTVQVVFNGEIYNYPELREKLLARGHVLRTHCDTEVLVHLYEDHGRDLVDHLEGDFAFALWDEKKNYFLLARDRLGIKPVFYANVGGCLVFASEMTALMAAGEIPRRMDDSALRTYLAIRRIPAPRTIYQDVRKLLPGHRVEAVNGRITISQYWDLHVAPDYSRREEDFAEELQHCIDTAVKRQLMSDVPLGAFLSGGVDSTIVASCMARHHRGAVKTFSIGYKEHWYDESRYYKLVSSRLGLEHHEFVFEPHLLTILPEMAYHFGEPCAIGSALPLYYLAKLAREFVTVVLTGDGSDEVFAGYPVYNFVKWLHMIRSACGGFVGGPLCGSLLNLIQYPTTSNRGRWLRRMKNVHQLMKKPESQWMRFLGNLEGLRENLLQNPAAGSEVAEYEDAFRSAQQDGDRAAAYLYADIKTLLPDEMFTKLDRMTMAHSMEGRVPLVDHKVVELAARIPSSLKIKGKRLKYILKKAMHADLPDEVLRRPKVGFRVPLNEWFRGPLREMAYDMLTDSSFRQTGLFRPDVVNSLLDQHVQQKDNHGSDILAIVMFEIWRREIHERHPAKIPGSIEA